MVISGNWCESICAAGIFVCYLDFCFFIGIFLVEIGNEKSDTLNSLPDGYSCSLRKSGMYLMF